MTADEEYMTLCIELAKKAAEKGECPVGAIVVDKDGRIIGEGYNMREAEQMPTAHAEIIAIEQAAKAMNSWRLRNVHYMLLLNLVHVCRRYNQFPHKKAVYGAFDEKGGACASLMEIFDYPFNHRPMVRSRVLQDECAKLLTDFFKDLRT